MLVLVDDDVVVELLVDALSPLDSFFAAAPFDEPPLDDEPARLSVR